MTTYITCTACGYHQMTYTDVGVLCCECDHALPVVHALPDNAAV